MTEPITRERQLESALFGLLGIDGPGSMPWVYYVQGFGYRCRYCTEYALHPKRPKAPRADDCPVSVAINALAGNGQQLEVADETR